jgi:HD-GYP domain-containing protein (c-di-GMP phosphodiesterase class II)
MNINFHLFIENLIAMIEAKDYYTSGHSDRVAKFSFLIAKHMGFDDDYCEMLHISAHLHDIGKVGIPDGILLKSSKLTAEEFAVIKTHSIIGYDILKNNPDFDEISLIIRHHHERMDGHGYPDGLIGEKIPMGSRIIAIADSFDAMVTNRPYKPVITFDEAKKEIIKCSGKQFDCNVVNAFISILDDKIKRREVEEIFNITKKEKFDID